MKKRLFVCLLLITFLVPLVTGAASADCGPKPSVKISFQGLEDEIYYVTLLSQTDSTGPWSWSEDYAEYYGEKAAWDAFQHYKDPDGYFFLGCFSDCSESDLFQWNYYPPATFKILIYFPAYERLVVSSETYSRYAFDSYYTVDATNLSIQDVAETADMKVSKSYDYDWEIFSLICRIILTIALELGLAWCFGFRHKKQLRIIYITNIVTQVVLNVALNLFSFFQGALAFLFHYVWMELVVFAVEAVIYRLALPRYETGRRLHPILYAFTANFLSFAAGLFLARIIPGIF